MCIPTDSTSQPARRAVYTRSLCTGQFVLLRNFSRNIGFLEKFSRILRIYVTKNLENFLASMGTFFSRDFSFSRKGTCFFCSLVLEKFFLRNHDFRKTPFFSRTNFSRTADHIYFTTATSFTGRFFFLTALNLLKKLSLSMFAQFKL